MRYLCVILFSLGLLSLWGQQTKVFSSDIRTVQVVKNETFDAFPVLELGTDDFVDVSFDLLSHDYRRYTYVITHHNADWSASNVQDIQFLEGFNDNPVEDYEYSRATTVDYTHYKLRLPNEYVHFKISGNYVVTFYEEGDKNKPVLSTCFRVFEKKSSISIDVSSDTDIDRNTVHQQVSFRVDHSGYQIRNPRDEVQVQVLQNNRTDNMVTNITPSFIGGNELRYEHKNELIFPAGNEYRRMEFVSTRYLSQGVESISYLNPHYNVFLYPSEKRNDNYIFDQDQNGRFLIRNSEAHDSDTEADYFQVHFALPWRERVLSQGKIYLEGSFTHNQFIPQYQLNYNIELEQYETVQLLKQGAYNYQYIYLPDGDCKGNTALLEGNYYQTENEYRVLVYHRPFGERYDKLIGYAEVLFK
ncbi:DUF5103 domain-containing protein [Bacteroides sp. 214]|uniref:type IX secretion system plug protein n=1 Tax=Bacteroides sp. 214 TaxID=2302935 RepID=UPI0013D6E657|nr:DUF5103 domain-containing protein [Bacteroides sp. 214]NDW13588.1 DUF5103 domain-containing protein [Bacteroides sp. 214]